MGNKTITNTCFHKCVLLQVNIKKFTGLNSTQYNKIGVSSLFGCSGHYVPTKGFGINTKFVVINSLMQSDNGDFRWKLTGSGVLSLGLGKWRKFLAAVQESERARNRPEFPM